MMKKQENKDMYEYLIYFLAFSFLGWCAEVLYHIFKERKFVNRGLAKGPICPIYGIGISLSYFILGSVKSFFLLAVFSMAIATAVELAAGFIFDKVFGVRLWDYRAERGNINGYVCPRFSLIWGIVCAAIIRLIPYLEPIIRLAASPRAAALVFTLSVLAFVDIEREIIKTASGDKRFKIE